LFFMENDRFFPEMWVRTIADGSLLAAGLLPLLLCRAGLS